MPRRKQISDRTRRTPPKRIHRWTSEMVTMLTVLWRDGKGDLQIARELNAEFGSELTRNAIQGRINGLKLPGKKGGMRGIKREKLKNAKKEITLREYAPKPRGEVGEKMQKSKQNLSSVEVNTQGDAEQKVFRPTPPVSQGGAKVEKSSPQSVATAVTVEEPSKIASASLDSVEEETLKNYRALLGWLPESGIWTMLALSGHEENCQTAFRRLPLSLRLSEGFPRFCRWIIGGEDRKPYFCGISTNTSGTSTSRQKTLCPKHMRHGVQGGTSDHQVVVSKAKIRKKAAIIK